MRDLGAGMAEEYGAYGAGSGERHDGPGLNPKCRSSGRSRSHSRTGISGVSYTMLPR